MAESGREKETTAPKENALVLRGVGQDGLASRKLSGDPIALYLLVFPFFAPLGCYSYSPCVFQGSDGRHGGPFIYQWAESASICSIYTYELYGASPPPRNSRYAMLGSFSLSLVLVSAAATTVSPT